MLTPGQEDMEEGYLAPAPASINNNQQPGPGDSWESSPEGDLLMERPDSPRSLSPEDTDIVHSAASDLVMHAAASAASAQHALTPGLVSVSPGAQHQVKHYQQIILSSVKFLAPKGA